VNLGLGQYINGQIILLTEMQIPIYYMYHLKITAGGGGSGP